MVTHEPGTAYVVRWREAVASSPTLASTTRLVLLTLSLDARPDGEDCYPSTRRLADRTALSRRSVEHHLRQAEEGGWIAREPVGSGQGWKRMSYTLLTPDVENEVPHEGGEGRSPRRAGVGKEVPHVPPGGGESDARRGEPDDEKVGKDVPLTLSSSSTTTTHPPESEREGSYPKLADLPRPNGGQRVYPPEFEGAYQALPDRAPRHEKGAAYTAWRRLTRNGADPFRLEAAADAYREAMEAEGNAGTRFVKLAATFFGPKAVWEDYSGIELGSAAPSGNGDHGGDFASQSEALLALADR